MQRNVLNEKMRNSVKKPMPSETVEGDTSDVGDKASDNCVVTSTQSPSAFQKGFIKIYRPERLLPPPAGQLDAMTAKKV